MAAPIRFFLIGGFLGAGKTTAIARLARHFQEQGKKVGIVTNDQAADLVDTHTLRAQGFDVGEVAGACFCCHFNELTDTVAALEEAQRPDVILAEPVGSCTDLVATVLQPLRRLFDARFDIAPYAVVLKPSHGERILGGEGQRGFSAKAAYIFTKQIEEADVVLINRADELTPEQADRLAALVEDHCPGTPVLRISAKTGAGWPALLEFLDQRGDFGRKILDIDYDTYAAGEAELGWLNASMTVAAADPLALDDLLVSMVDRLRISLDREGAETAHLKVIGLADGDYGVANLINSSQPPALSLPSSATVRRAEIIVNARVALAPERLQAVVEADCRAAAAALAASLDYRQAQAFRPGRPVPTHRFAAAE